MLYGPQASRGPSACLLREGVSIVWARVRCHVSLSLRWVRGPLDTEPSGGFKEE